jgi:E3 ubiquitin-protein ligase BRE1
MEDRKRPAMGDDEAAPPAKRQAVTVNGARPHADADLPWKDFNIEVRPLPTSESLITTFAHPTNRAATPQTFQKDAILRQMKEYKREKAALENQVAKMEKRAAYHDDHLRVIDVWFSQVGSVAVPLIRSAQD